MGDHLNHGPSRYILSNLIITTQTTNLLRKEQFTPPTPLTTVLQLVSLTT
ncbi:hypothetical protein THTE_2407 [Thermogutta terrifontis]|uniref:Uncharacterized protein n=1 Tax=Thermogutta terrifontis TaxID=1331910 RepID=A0A286RGB9_9BACT|nr:hypothetical protein THTE_2407 [Thermogutta terrifontis]